MGIGASMASRAAPTPVLSEQEAWAIAMGWRRRLQGFVRLDTAAPTGGGGSDSLSSADASSGCFAVVPSYEWVSFVFNRRAPFDCKDPKGAAAAARAATIAWAALASCVGFSGDENPQFWRRVFSSLARIPECPYQPVVTDSVGFFDRPDKAFPRVRIIPKRGFESKTLRLFASPTTHKEAIEELLVRLRPYMLPHRWARAIAVAVDDVEVESLASILPTIQTDGASSPDFPLLYPQTLCVRSDCLGSDVAIQGLLSRTDANIRVGTYHHSTTNPFRAYRMVNSLVASQTATSARIHIDVLDLTGVMATEGKCQQVCSALPSTRAVSTVQLSDRPVDREDFHATNVAWLGYAMFHPDAAESSSFANLSVEMRSLRRDQLQILARMAVGNNLLSTASKAYFEGTVKAGTTVHASDHKKSEVVHSFPSQAKLMLCVTTPEPPKWGPWVRAVVPGVGLGWLRRDNICKVVARAPGPSCVRRLRLDVGPQGLDDHTEGLLFKYLSLFGARLSYLDVVSLIPLAAETVQFILRACPSLESLRVHHDGLCWSDEEMTMLTPELPRLKALELRIDGSGDHVPVLNAFKARQLDDLEVLRVLTPVRNSFSDSREACLAILELYPRLSYFHWQGFFARHRWDNGSCDERRLRSFELLGDIVPGVHDVALVPLRFECRLAFLSVIRQSRKVSSSIMSQIGPDIARTIFGFLSSSSPRVVSIRDE